MGRLVDVDELVTTSEIAQRLGYARHVSVHRTMHRNGSFPEPVAFVGKNRQIRLWLWSDVRRWSERSQRPTSHRPRPRTS